MGRVPHRTRTKGGGRGERPDPDKERGTVYSIGAPLGKVLIRCSDWIRPGIAGSLPFPGL
jgi:hypothetical protein